MSIIKPESMEKVKAQSQPLSSQVAAEMGKAVQLWLDYQILCGRGMLLSESYLAHPVGEFLRTRHNGGIAAEWTCPDLQSKMKKRRKAKRGRPRQVDYALFGANSEYPLTAIEAKWVTEKSRQLRQRFVNDVLRLEIVRNENGPMNRFFLVAGMVSEVESFLADVYNTHAYGKVNFVESFLPLVGEKNIYVEKCASHFRPFFKKFHETYQTELPKSYKASLVFDSEHQVVKNEIQDTYAEHLGGIDEHRRKVRVLLWRVKSVSKRSTFHPSDADWDKIESIETN